MKLLVNATCIVSGELTGIERFALRISEELYHIDRTVKIVSTKPVSGIPFLGISWPLGLAKKWLGTREYFIRAVWDQIFFRYHAIKSNYDLVFFPIQDGLFFPPLKQIVTVHDLHYLHFEKSMLECRDEISPLRTNLYQIKMPHVLRYSSAVVTVSESTKRDIVTFFGICPDKIHVIYNGYDEQRFRIIENPQPVLDRFGMQLGEYFLFVGSILRHKNLTRFVQAFALLDSKVKLVISGVSKDVDYLHEIRKAAADFRVSDDRIRYLEYVSDEDLPYLYNGAIAFMLPSLHEGFGVPIIEAMACGTPVITSNCSAMPEVAGDAALLVDPYSVENIAAAMKEILYNPQRAEALREAGLERAKMFKWSYSAQKLYNLCRSVSES